MKKHYVVSTITFILFLIGSGSFPFAEEKKTVSPPPANSQQGCSEDDKKNSGPDISRPSPATPENKTANPDALKPPSGKTQEETESEG